MTKNIRLIFNLSFNLSTRLKSQIFIKTIHQLKKAQVLELKAVFVTVLL